MDAGASAVIDAAVAVASVEEQEDKKKWKAAALSDGGGGASSVAEIVCEGMRELGWSEIKPIMVTVDQQDDKPVYKVSAAGATPPTVMFRFRAGPPVSLKERRTEAAAKIFGAAGVSPGRLVDGETWWIEPWVGATLNEGRPCVQKGTFDVKDASQREKVLQAAADLGRLTARIHSIPTEWFEPFYEEECKTYPFLRDMPKGNFLWLYQYWRGGEGREGCDFDDMMQMHAKDPQPLKKVLVAIPKPLCPALSRVVTSHGDLWHDNVLHSPSPGGGLLACDVESACVMSAIWDFMHCQIEYFEEETKLVHENSGGDGPSFARTTVEAYLQQLGEPCGKDEVDAALFDIRCFMDALHIRGSMDAIYAGQEKINLAYVEEFGSRLRKHWEDPELRSAVLSEPHVSPSSYLVDLNKHMHMESGSGPFICSDT